MTTLKEKWMKIVSRFNLKMKNIYLAARQRIKNTLIYLGDLNIDFVFVFAATFLLTIPYSIWARLLGSIGALFIYNKIVKDIRSCILEVKR